MDIRRPENQIDLTGFFRRFVETEEAGAVAARS
jgi:hypothetical protein